MFIIDYLYLTPTVYQAALERTQEKCEHDKLYTSTLVYNEDSHYSTNILYNDMIHLRYLLYIMTKYVIELWDECQ
jgi:hypothetical protein